MQPSDNDDTLQGKKNDTLQGNDTSNDTGDTDNKTEGSAGSSGGSPESQATFTAGDDSVSATMTGEATSDNNFGLEVGMNRYLGSNRETQFGQIQTTGHDGGSIVTGEKLKGHINNAIANPKSDDGETIKKYMKNAWNEKGTTGYFGGTKETNLGTLMKNKFGDNEPTDAELNAMIISEQNAGNKLITEAIINDCHATSLGKMHKSTWIGQEQKEQFKRYNPEKSGWMSRQFSKLWKPSRETMAKSGKSTMNPLKGEMGFKKLEDGRIVMKQQMDWGGTRKYAANKNYAKSVLNALRANDLAGKDVEITINSKDPEVVRRKIKALTEQAIKQGIPLSSITIKTPHLPQQAEGIMSKGFKMMKSMVGFKGATTPPQTLDKITKDYSEGKSPYGFSMMSSLYSAIRVPIQGGAELLRIDSGRTQRKHGSNMGPQWGKSALQRNKGRENPAYKEAYAKGYNDLPPEKAEKLLDECAKKHDISTEEKCDMIMSNPKATDKEKHKKLSEELKIKKGEDGKFDIRQGESALHEDPTLTEKSEMAKNYNKELDAHFKDEMEAYKNFSKDSGYNDFMEYNKLIKEGETDETKRKKNGPRVEALKKKLGNNTNFENETIDSTVKFKLTPKAQSELDQRTINVAEAYNLKQVYGETKGINNSQISPFNDNDKKAIHDASLGSNKSYSQKIKERTQGPSQQQQQQKKSRPSDERSVEIDIELGELQGQYNKEIKGAKDQQTLNGINAKYKEKLDRLRDEKYGYLDNSQPDNSQPGSLSENHSENQDIKDSIEDTKGKFEKIQIKHAKRLKELHQEMQNVSHSNDPDMLSKLKVLSEQLPQIHQETNAEMEAFFQERRNAMKDIDANEENKDTTALSAGGGSGKSEVLKDLNTDCGRHVDASQKRVDNLKGQGDPQNREPNNDPKLGQEGGPHPVTPGGY